MDEDMISIVSERPICSESTLQKLMEMLNLLVKPDTFCVLMKAQLGFIDSHTIFRLEMYKTYFAIFMSFVRAAL